MVNWLNISWCFRFWAVRGFSLGWVYRFLDLVFFSFLGSASFSRPLQVNARESIEDEDFIEERGVSELWLLLDEAVVEVVALLSAELADLCRARRIWLRMDMVKGCQEDKIRMRGVPSSDR